MCVCSVVSDSVTPWSVARQIPLSMGLSRQECCSGLPFPSPGDLPDPDIEPGSLVSPSLSEGLFITMPPRLCKYMCVHVCLSVCLSTG